MAGAHSLRGLMKWLTRHEWRDRFAEVYDAHLQPACERLGVDVDEVVSILGQDWFMTTVWGSAFEDFLTRDFDGGHNIVDDYLKRRGWKESASTRAYITALRTSVASLYEVSDIIKDTSFRARDLVRGGNPILISERSATRSLKQWDRIAARVVQVGSHAQISGALLPYEREASEDILRLLRDVAKRTDKERQKLANQVGGDVNHPAIVDGFSQNAMLRAAAPTITTFWLIDIINRAVDPPDLDIRNTEGDELLFCAVHFPLSADATADDIRQALSRCPALRQETTTFWNWFGPGKPAKALPRQKGTSQVPYLRHNARRRLACARRIGIEGQHIDLVCELARSEQSRAALCCPSFLVAWWASPWSRCKRLIRSCHRAQILHRAPNRNLSRRRTSHHNPSKPRSALSGHA